MSVPRDGDDPSEPATKKPKVDNEQTGKEGSTQEDADGAAKGGGDEDREGEQKDKKEDLKPLQPSKRKVRLGTITNQIEAFNESLDDLFADGSLTPLKPDAVAEKIDQIYGLLEAGTDPRDKTRSRR